MKAHALTGLAVRCFVALGPVCGALGCGDGSNRPDAADLAPQQPQPQRQDQTETSAPDNPSTATARNVVALGSCVDSSVVECRLYLPSYNGVQPCYVGEQHCVEATWGPCQGVQLVDANREDAPIPPPTP